MTKQYPMKYPLRNWRAANMNWGIQILCHDAPNIVIAALRDSLQGPIRSPAVKAAGDLIASAPTLAAEVDRLQTENEALRAVAEMAYLALTVYDNAELTPAHVEIRERARALGMTPKAYVVDKVRAVLAKGGE